ncbi:MAG: acyl-CoA synthase, partial [Chitinophagaceae bacterium]
MNQDQFEALDHAGALGMSTAYWARAHPDKVAVYDPSGRTKTFAEVNGNANRLVRLFRQSGLRPGDAVALICSNRAEFIEVFAATLRAGLRLTPVNWHLTPEEIAYIVTDCEARALIGEARVGALEAVAAERDSLVLKLAVGGSVSGFAHYDEALASLDGADVPDPVMGNQMLYTSGTTGRPKGVLRAAPLRILAASLAARG